MSRPCCNNACNQGRSCPLRTVKIPTRRSLTARIGDLLDDHKWLPLAVVVVVICFLNS